MILIVIPTLLYLLIKPFKAMWLSLDVASTIIYDDNTPEDHPNDNVVQYVVKVLLHCLSGFRLGPPALGPGNPRTSGSNR